MTYPLNILRELLVSNARLGEFLLLLHDKKPVCRFVVNNLSLQAHKDLAAAYAMHLIIGSQVNMQHEPGTTYSNKGILGRGDATLCYLSKKESFAQQAKECEEQGNITLLGEFLGYPPCCCSFFARAKPTQTNDYFPATIERSRHDNRVQKTYPYQNNIALRYDDICLLSHFPCDLHCEESRILAQEYEQIFKLHRERYVKILERYLRGTVLFVPEQGSVYLHGAKREGYEIVFDNFAGSCTQELKQFLENKRIIADSPDTILINGQSVKAYVLTFV